MGLSKETASKFISAAIGMNYVFGYKDYSHSDFTSIMVGNTEKGNNTWARYIGGRYAVFENGASRGYSADKQTALDVVSGYGKYGLAVDWSSGAGGRNSKTEVTERFFGGYYKFSSCLQEAFGGPKSGDWADEEAAKKFIAWSETVSSLKDIVKVTTLKQDKVNFKIFKQFITDMSLKIEEDKEAGLEIDLRQFQDNNLPEEIKSHIRFYNNSIYISNKRSDIHFIQRADGTKSLYWREIKPNYGWGNSRNPDDFASWAAGLIKFIPTFDPNTFLS